MRGLRRLGWILIFAACGDSPRPQDDGDFILNLYDAFGPEVPGTVQDFGFAAVIRYRGKTILFDSGTNAAILKKNVEALGIDPALNARLPGLAAEMISEDPKDRGRAAVRLGETGDPAVAEPLRRLTADPDADVRRLAYAALALTAGEEAVDDLDAGTRDPDPAVRGASLSLLSFAHGKRGVDRAREMESDSAPEVQTVVDRVLGRQEIVIKSLPARFHNVREISGGAVLGDGSVCLVLDVAALVMATRTTSDDLEVAA